MLRELNYFLKASVSKAWDEKTYSRAELLVNMLIGAPLLALSKA